MQKRYFEDLHVGDTVDLGSYKVTEEEILTFARQFDPQPFHIDKELARNSLFGGLIASGWHTSSILMRLLVDRWLNHTMSLGSPGVEEIRWPRPVRPGDTLHARLTVLSSTPSRSRPNMGIIRSKSEMFNQDGELVMSLVATNFFGRNSKTSEHS